VRVSPRVGGCHGGGDASSDRAADHNVVDHQHQRLRLAGTGGHCYGGGASFGENGVGGEAAAGMRGGVDSLFAGGGG